MYVSPADATELIITQLSAFDRNCLQTSISTDKVTKHKEFEGENSNKREWNRFLISKEPLI